MHRPLAQAAHRPRTQRRVMARTRRYRGPLPGRVTPVPSRVLDVPFLFVRTRALWSAVSQPPRRDTENRLAIQLLPRALCAESRAHSVVSQHGRCRVVGRVATQKSPSATIQHLYHNSPASQAARARCRTADRVMAHVGRVVGPCRKASWLCRGHPAARPSALCHDTIHCIVTQTEKWAVAHPVSCTIFFFLPLFQLS